jgi:hypothetical protein
MNDIIEVEQVVIGSDGTVYRSENVKRRLAYQKSVGNKVWSRLAIAPKLPKAPTPNDQEGKGE